MIVNRNEPCPCGSGKKFKKCCLKNENVIQLSKVKEERFFTQKKNLVDKLREFFTEKLSYNEHMRLHTEFKNRTGRSLSQENDQAFFTFWLYFFHRFEENGRGIEWFYSENQSKLSEVDRQFAKSWTELLPRIVQAVDATNSEVLFEDIITKETFNVPNNKEALPIFAPWYGTIGVLEPFDNQYYFNGVRVFEGPSNINNALLKVEDLIEETKKSATEVLIDYYPEILLESLKNERDTGEAIEQKTISEYKLDYNVHNHTVLQDFIHNEGFVIDKWDDKVKSVNWTSSWKCYKDSELSGEVLLADVYALIDINEDVLTFKSIDIDKINEFKSKLGKLGVAITFKEESVHTFEIPYYAEIRNTVLRVDDNTPQYFGMFAQQHLGNEIEVPIPKYNGHSIRELVEQGKVRDAETWLKQTEYLMYMNVLKQFGKVEVTADHNTARKILGLPLSPFVTGGENRTSSMENVVSSKDGFKVEEEDIPYLESLEFTPDTVDNFYSEDFVDFFKDKTGGKSEATVRKYKNSLVDLKELLERSSRNSWSELNYEFWEQLISKDYLSMYEVASKTLLKDFLSTLKAFTKWLDKKYSMSLSKDVTSIVKEYEEKLIEKLLVLR
ncbi:SEC-C domain-containing protein [Bacillus sp. FJAT-45350]|uniref:SEC-C domain-containing protein n=1 Tax=Bacillus sp. FJAT-45350 TaxID=2011014 RepID=UPI0015C7B360|nr:SEC-C domain-containing protein [Bacillus sp. FJAT-45350]